MDRVLGISAYVSSFDQYKSFYSKFIGSKTPVFTSLHIPEEGGPDFPQAAREMLAWLRDHDFYLIVDISPRTLDMLELDSLDDLIQDYQINNIRLDFGFELGDILNMKSQADLTFNASQQGLYNQLRTYDLGQRTYYFMHNFYPRPDTGNDVAYFMEMNQAISHLNQEPIAFIASNTDQRGPLYQGLPTLEHHRYLLPYVQFVEMVRLYGVNQVFIGDHRIDDVQLDLMSHFIQEDILAIPVDLDSDYDEILEQVFTVRTDSPVNIHRLLESRGYQPRQDWTAPRDDLQVSRQVGDITLDNDHYQRYAGEIQILNQSLAADPKVNVIGKVHEDYLALLACIQRDSKIKFVQL